jgi:hypothetical protein
LNNLCYIWSYPAYLDQESIDLNHTLDVDIHFDTVSVCRGLEPLLMFARIPAKRIHNLY